MATFLDSLKGGMQLGQTVRGLQDQGNINRLAGQAANSSGMERTSALNQMWGVNPEMAAKQETALGTSEDRRNKGMVQAARMLSGAPEAMRPGLYQQMKPMLSQYGLQLPEQYDNTVAEAANALVQAYGGIADSAPSGLRQFQGIAEAAGLKSGTPEYQRAARVNLGLDPRAVTAAVRFDTFTDANGNPRPQRNNPTTGQVEIFIDESNQWQPLGGGISVQQPPHTGANTIFTTSDGAQIDVSTVEDPYVRQQILANPDAFGMVPDMGAVQLPDRDTSRVTRQAPRGIGIGQSRAAEAAAVEQAKTNVQLNALPAELGMRTQAAINQAVGIDEGKAQAERARDAEQKLTRVTNDASNMLAMIERVKNSPGREIVTGLSGTLDPRAYLPGGAAADFRANLQQLQGSAFLQAFESLKGGGAITEIEGKKAEQAIAALQTDQSDEGFMRSIATLEQVIRDGVAKAQRDASRLGRGQQSPQPQQQGAVRIQNAEDYSRLPSGALYITPTGETRRKR